MKRSLMVFSAIAAFALPAMAPVATLAQDGSQAEAPSPRPSRGNRGDRDASRGRSGGDDNVQARVERSQGGGENRRQNRQERRRNEGGGNDGGQGGLNGGGDRGQNRPERPRGEGGWNGGGDRGQNRPDRPRGDGGWNGGGDRGQNRPDRPRGDGGWNGGGDRGQNRPDRPRDNGGWNNNDRNNGGWNRDRDRDRREWRNRFDSRRWQQNWTRQRGYDWWRNDRRFRGWSGVRLGFYFAPGYGYYSVPRNYYGRQYYEGQYLPSIFWRYRLDDYRTYGLGYPPEGTRWVYVDNSIYLIDEYDGYIIDVIRDAWRW